jgi:hypothetical protein
MKKNFDVPLLDARGKPCKTGDTLLTVADAAIASLTEPAPDDAGLTGKEKIALMSLAVRISEGGEREFTKDELVTIKRRAEKNCHIISFARLCEIIDSDEQTGESA